MYEECQAEVRMQRMILKDGYYDETTYYCSVITYNPEEEDIYLLSGEAKLPVFSLDGIYECRIHTQEGEVSCVGVIEERYWNKLGNVIRVNVKNVFYKNLVN